METQKKAIALILGLFLLVSGSMKAQTEPNLYSHVNREQMNHWVDSVFNRMSLDERIGQLFMVIADPKSDSRNMQRLMRFIHEMKIGGILFHKDNPVTQAEITNRLQKVSRIPIMVSLDGEWGLSMRLSGTTRFPKNMMLGAIKDNELIELYGEEVGRQCKEMGIHVNFAPDIDINSNVDNPIIGLRSFGEDPDAVTQKGLAYARGLENSGILSVAKHFPGHGDTFEDSHETLPTIYHSRSRLDSIELQPFKKYIKSGFGGVMTAHLFVPSLEKRRKHPVSLSKAVVTDLLQQELGFQGLCFTDALAMKGAAIRKSDNPSVLALKAGNDVLLAPAAPFTDFAAVKAAIETGLLAQKDIEARCKKVLRYKYMLGLADYHPAEIKGLSKRLNSAHAEWLASRLNAEAITLLQNRENFVPLKQLDTRKMAVLSIGESVHCEFQQMLNSYDSLACFSITRRSTPAQIQDIYNKLMKYDVIVCGVHTVRIPESAALKQLASKKNLVYAFFTLPYFCKKYKASIQNAKSVIMAYENTPLAQKYAAQAIFGGISVKGKLPVSIPELYPVGTGVSTEKNRLGYHEPEEVGLNAEQLDVISEIAQEGVDKKAYPGCQVLVAKDGIVVYNQSFGYYDNNLKQKVDENAVYDLASASKACGTLLAVMKAYDNKKFNLNDKISQHIPELKKSNKQNLTIKELLYHQSGLIPTINYYSKALVRGKRPLQFDSTLVSTEKRAGFTQEIAKGLFVNTQFQDSIIQSIKESKMGIRGRYKYGCTNFILLKIMSERWMQQPMDHLLDQQFFRRLGAWHTTYNPLKRMDTLQIVPTENDITLRHQLIRGYVHDEAAAFQGGVSGNAGLFSNANDLAKVLQLYLNNGCYGGESYLSSETTRMFTQNKSPNSRRGLGFDKPEPGNVKGSPCGQLAPNSVFGHTGFTGTCFWVDPDNQIIYIFLSNRIHPSRDNHKLSGLNIRTRIQDAIYKAIDKKSVDSRKEKSSSD